MLSLLTADQLAWRSSFPLVQRWLWGMLALVIVAGAAPVAWAQGGAAISVGISVQNSANAAAEQSANNHAAPQPGMPAAGGRGRSVSGPPGPAAMDDGGEAGYSESEYEPEYEYEDEDGYGGQGYDGQMGRRGAGRGGDVIGTATDSLAGSLAEFFNRPLSESESRFKPTLYEQAALAVHRGDQRQALSYYHAHLIAERESATAALDSVRFSPLLRRPVWAMRLGVSINAKVPDALADDPQPIRDGDKPDPARGGGGYEMESAEGGGDAAPLGRAAAANRGRSLEESAAESGESLEEMISADGFESDTAPYAPQGELAKEPSTAGGRGTIMAEETLDQHLGLLADVLKAELSKRISAGKFGSAWAELASRGAALAAQAPPRSELGQSGNGNAAVMWIPGVDYLGAGIAPQMIEKARENEIDLLFHFEVVVKETRTEEPQYRARCRVVNVTTGDTLGASKLMDKRDITLAARRSDVRTVVEEMLAPAMDVVDSKAVVQTMPPLVPRQAMARIDALLASPQATRMVRLAEMSMFQHLGLIDQDQLEQVVFFAAGEEGLRLLYDEHERRVELASEMVLKELEQN